jgi:branched-chain amino acid transport system substrate-binding protein
MNKINRRAALTGGIAAAAVATGPIARAASTRDMTPTTLKIGNTMPYSGSASAYSSVGKAASAFFKWVND